MSKKHLLEIVKEDFQMPDLPDEENTIPLRPRTKSLNSARLIPIQDIFPDPNQPRKTFDEDSLRELAESIKSKGVIQPITARPNQDQHGTYLIITGERRFRAAKIADLKEIPCIVKDVTEQEALILQMIENLQREELTPVEEAKSIRRLIEAGLTQTDVSKFIGKSQPYISQILKILTLPETIFKETKLTEVSKEHLLQLAKSDKPEQLWQQIKQGKTARETQIQVQKQKHPKGRPKNYRYLYSPKGKTYRVTVEFRKPDAEREEVREALNDTLNNLTLTNPTSHN